MTMLAERTARKQPTGRPFKPGQSGYPAGRPKGSRNRLSERFLSALADDFEKHGEDVIARVREAYPAVYLRILASLLPTQVEIDAETTPMRSAGIEAVAELLSQALAVTISSGLTTSCTRTCAL